MHGRGAFGRGVCVVGGMCGRGCVWQKGLCGRGSMHGMGGMHGSRGMRGMGGRAWQQRWSLQGAVRILLECILVQ